MRRLWVRNGKPLALMATAPQGKGSKLALEIGDILYELDPDILSTQSRNYPDVVLVYSRLDPWLLFRRLGFWPPAYAQRVVPIDVHVEPTKDSVIDALAWLTRFIEGEVVWVEVVVRGSKRLESSLRNAIIEYLVSHGYRVARREAPVVKLECIPGEACGMTIMWWRCDRVELWWKEGVTKVCKLFKH